MKPLSKYQIALLLALTTGFSLLFVSFMRYDAVAKLACSEEVKAQVSCLLVGEILYLEEECETEYNRSSRGQTELAHYRSFFKCPAWASCADPLIASVVGRTSCDAAPTQGVYRALRL